MKILATLGDSLIVGINGRLRVIDTAKKRRCMGYQNSCHCPRCQEQDNKSLRKRLNLDAKKAAKCECGGRAFNGQDTCYRCGKAVARAA